MLGEPERVVGATGIVCEHNCLSLETASAEMKGVAAQNARVKDPVYHVVLSWPSEDVPSEGQAFASGRRAVNAVGMEGHQYVFALHRDTAHVHLHVAVNRVHPDSFVAVYPDRDFFKLDRTMRELELEHGWKHDKGPYAVFDRGGVKVIDWASKDPASAGKRPSRASDMERHGDTESLFTYARGAPRGAIKAALESPACDWAAVHGALAQYGLELREKGRGLAVYDVGGQSTTPIKASDMDESMSKGHLEARLGRFVAQEAGAASPPVSAYDKMRSPKRDPARREQQRQERADARRALYDRYGAYTSSFSAPRQDSEEVKRRYRKIVEEAKRRRSDVRAVTRSAAERKALYSIIAFETLRSREKLKSGLAEERNAIRMDPSSRRMRFREWVEVEAEKGDQGAISQLRGWAYAERRDARLLETVLGDLTRAGGFRGPEQVDPIARELGHGASFTVERSGTVLYRDASGAVLFRDHGQLVEAAADAGDAGLAAAGAYAREKFGPDLKATGRVAQTSIPEPEVLNGVQSAGGEPHSGEFSGQEKPAIRRQPRKPRMR